MTSHAGLRQTHPGLALWLSQSHSDDDLAHLKSQRAFFARAEQQKDLPRSARRYCQRQVKAISCAINHIVGKPTLFPSELRDDIATAFGLADAKSDIGKYYSHVLGET